MFPKHRKIDNRFAFSAEASKRHNKSSKMNEKVNSLSIWTPECEKPNTVRNHKSDHGVSIEANERHILHWEN